MRSSTIARVALALLLAMQPLLAFSSPASHAQYAQQYAVALPGYHYEFPRDHFDHPDYQTEWWYYTGNVTSADGRHFGFELTFFRQGVNRDATKTNSWDVRD